MVYLVPTINQLQEIIYEGSSIHIKILAAIKLAVNPIFPYSVLNVVTIVTLHWWTGQ